jgi:hypothetical protein
MLAHARIMRLRAALRFATVGFLLQTSRIDSVFKFIWFSLAANVGFSKILELFNYKGVSIS